MRRPVFSWVGIPWRSLPVGQLDRLDDTAFREFRDLLRRTIEIHQRLYREWPQLARTYREALPDITSPERWSKTFQASITDGAP